METKVVTAHVPLPLAEKVDKLAERLERPRGWIVKQARSAWVEQEEERYRLTLWRPWQMSMPVPLSTIRPYKRGRIAWTPKSRCRRRADGTAVVR